ncbi:MAG: cell division protein FtsH [Pirellula sp.]
MNEENAYAFALKATAYHEAGHAVMALFLGRPIDKVTIAPGKSAIGVERLGACHIKKGQGKGSKDWLEDEVMILLAGMVAESQITGQYCAAGAAQDLRFVRRFLQSRAAGERQVERLERRLLSKTENYLSERALWSAIEKIAAELLKSQTISGRAARHLFEEANGAER